MANQLQNFIRGKHFRFEMKYFFELVVVNPGIAGCKNQHTAVGCFKGKCFGNSGAFHAESSRGQIHGSRGDGELPDTVLQAEGTKICSAFCDRHGLITPVLNWFCREKSRSGKQFGHVHAAERCELRRGETAVPVQKNANQLVIG